MGGNQVCWVGGARARRGALGVGEEEIHCMGKDPGLNN